MEPLLNNNPKGILAPQRRERNGNQPVESVQPSLELREPPAEYTSREMLLTERIKHIIVELIHYTDDLPAIKLSVYISEKIGISYPYLSKLFSRIKRITIEQFIIAHKIEKVKQLLSFNEMKLSEIAWKMNYSSTAHLSAQFKKVTGLTPSVFKSRHSDARIPSEFL